MAHPRIPKVSQPHTYYIRPFVSGLPSINLDVQWFSGLMKPKWWQPKTKNHLFAPPKKKETPETWRIMEDIYYIYIHIYTRVYIYMEKCQYVSIVLGLIEDNDLCSTNSLMFWAPAGRPASKCFVLERTWTWALKVGCFFAIKASYQFDRKIYISTL